MTDYTYQWICWFILVEITGMLIFFISNMIYEMINENRSDKFDIVSWIIFGAFTAMIGFLIGVCLYAIVVMFQQM